MKKPIAFFLAVTLFMTIVPAVAAQSRPFADVPQNHWAAASIAKAVEAGYVSGFPDGTFKPDQVVTREEFIKMVIEAFGLDTSRYTASISGLWSYPYLALAAEEGWIAKDEYDLRKDTLSVEGYTNRGARIAVFQKKDGDLLAVHADTANFPIPRHEMAKIAINALGKSVEKTGKDWEYKNAVMQQAVNLGIIRGVGNGHLAPDGTSTRAQAVVVIERMLTLKNGGTLAVDKEAQETASKAYDPWGRAIRTTNLPKNASEFPYILEDIPNEMYEMPFYKRDEPDFISPKELADSGLFTKEALDISLSRVEKALNLILNVDYRTIDPEAWGKELAENQRGGSSAQSYMNALYAESAIENRLHIEGTAKVEPSMIYDNGPGWYVRAKVKFKIHNYDKTSDRILYNYTFKQKLETGVWYEGYADICFSSVTYGPSATKEAGLYVGASLFEWAMYNGTHYHIPQLHSGWIID